MAGRSIRAGTRAHRERSPKLGGLIPYVSQDGLPVTACAALRKAFDQIAKQAHGAPVLATYLAQVSPHWFRDACHSHRRRHAAALQRVDQLGDEAGRWNTPEMP